MNYTEAFVGSRNEVYRRAVAIALGLQQLLGQADFTCRVERTDRPGKPYEVRHDGHTID